MLVDIYEPFVGNELGVPERPHTHFEYDTNGLLSKITNPRGDTENFYYGYGGRLDYSVDFEGNRYTYGAQMAKPLVDFANNSPSTPAPAILADDFAATETNERGFDLRKVLQFGQTSHLTDQLGNVFEYTLEDKEGRVKEFTQTIELNGGPSVSGGSLQEVTTTYDYESAGGIYPMLLHSERITWHDGEFQEFELNDLGGNFPRIDQVEVSTDELGRQIIRSYDKFDTGVVLDNLQRTSIVSERVVIGLNDLESPETDDLVRHFSYRPYVSADVLPNGLLQAETDAEGRVTSYDYHNDAAYDKNVPSTWGVGLLKTITLPIVNGVSSDIEYDYEFVTDAAGVFTMIVTEHDELDRVRKYHYDALDRLVKVEEPHPTIASTFIESTYKYDLNGNVGEQTDAEGNITKFEYDKMDRLIKKTDADPDQSDPLLASPVTEYTYDEIGNLRAIIDPLTRVTSYQYDAANRLIAVIEPDSDGIITVSVR